MEQIILNINGRERKCYYLTKHLVMYFDYTSSYFNVYKVIDIFSRVHIRTYYTRSMKEAITLFKEEYNKQVNKGGQNE